MATRTRETLSIEPLDAPLGAAIRGIDLARPLDAATRAAVIAAWHRHLVLVFPGQDIDADQQFAFVQLFGTLKKRSRPKQLRPEAEGTDYDGSVMFISNIVENGVALGSLPDGEMWFHHDGIYEEKPQRASFLYAIELPSRGGNTRFANMYKAYEAVPADLRKRLEGRNALHVYHYEMRHRYEIEQGLEGIPHFIHPVFITHPDTGRKALYVDRLMTARIDGLDKAESDAVLAELYAIGEDPSVVYEHEWTVGDLLMWDNLCSMHARTDFPDEERRLLRRCTIEGVRPQA